MANTDADPITIAGIYPSDADSVPAPMEMDLATESGVRAYLAKTVFAGAVIAPLTGGTANYAYRLRLKEKYGGRETVVLKHAKPYVKNWKALAFAIERQKYEVEALRRVGAWLPADSVVKVPEVHLFDEEEHVIIMEDTGEDTISLKTFMQQGRASLTVAQQIGAAVGTFLGSMHKWGQGNMELCESVRGNAHAKGMSAWVFYGRLMATLSGESGVLKLSDPPLVAAEEDLKVVEKVAEETTQACLGVDDSFVMGDFWPGNMMVQVEEGNLKRITVLDWELTKTGLTGMDIGQFCGEVHMLRRCQPEVCKETASAVLEHFMKEYKRTCAPDEKVVRRAITQWGAHMTILGARVEWGGKELSREVVLEGVRILVDGQKDLRTSFVAPLL